MFGFAYQSKADRSMNWREPASGGAGLKKWGKPSPYYKAPSFKTTAFAKKPVLVNPFPPSEFWHDFTDFSTLSKKVEELDKCELCKRVISKACFPQRLDECRHVFCAGCIHKHFVTENKDKCPTCSTYIDYTARPDFCQHCYSAPCSCMEDAREQERDYDDDYMCPDCGENYCSCDGCQGCRQADCGGDCGCLPCGCIDFCKGKCERDDEDALW
jgi:hypothetical protein